MCNEETLGLIEREFDLYKYHTREEMNGKKRNGWIRTMFYSAIQHLVRQDPVYYALNVAAQPDLNWRLVSYPYYTKDTSAGENTGFKHLDLNVPELLAEGRGENIIQSSVSIDDEYEDGCTIVVPGFQRNICEWWVRVEARGMTANGPTTGVAKTYTKDDERVFGAFIPTPCRRGGIRITRPEILHGSTPYCRTRRRTILPCFIAVSEDHHSLENSKCESWAELSACHREMEAPKRSTSGFGFAYGGPGFRFPATVQLASSSALGDAIVCGRRWDDPLVLGELKILLGACEKNAMHYVESCRRRLVENYITAAKAVFEIERVTYGNRSFSRRDSLPDAHACEDDTYSTLGLSDYSCDGASRGD
ncbi:hypothetical protein L873DRAFT_1725222 [Choiromyces venosus 120613-1]|uniref:PhyH-domain-containing protein n=1 Tax=Choiromyces venosus 120613-1 TaxID=1336337 RepID=A0A3N4ISC5_9PEZI|nr:hypothetical protein L873DRAFT_1725222 [Choiromyces venosus 120613-1]